MECVKSSVDLNYLVISNKWQILKPKERINYSKLFKVWHKSYSAVLQRIQNLYTFSSKNIYNLTVKAWKSELTSPAC